MLPDHRQKYKKSMLLRHNNSNRKQKCKVTAYIYICTGMFCDLQMARCGRKSHQIVCLLGIFS